MRNIQLDICPLAGAIGAEIHGVDLIENLDDVTVADIRRALLDHCVIFFRDQQFDAAQQKALARRFGDIFIHPNHNGTGPDPEILEVRREPGDMRIIGVEWHADTTIMPEKPRGDITYAHELTPHSATSRYVNHSIATNTQSNAM